MRHNSMVVFDEFVGGPSITTWTSASMNNKLAQFDSLAILAVADNSSGTAPQFSVQIQHSCDGRTWYNKSGTSPQVPAGSGGTPEIILTSVAVNTTVQAYGADNGFTPFLGLVRLQIATGANTLGLHLKVMVTQRDQG